MADNDNSSTTIASLIFIAVVVIAIGLTLCCFLSCSIFKRCCKNTRTDRLYEDRHRHRSNQSQSPDREIEGYLFTSTFNKSAYPDMSPQMRHVAIEQAINVSIAGDMPHIMGQCCHICLNAYEVDESIASRRGGRDECRHIFHRRCIIQWLMKHDSCPCCRAAFNLIDSGDTSSLCDRV